MTGKMYPFVTHTWNCVKGCTHGCSYCWAWRFSKRIYDDGFDLRLFPERLRYTKKGQTVFVCDMGDLFCDDVPDAWITFVIDAMGNADSTNTFLLLTKNPRRYSDFAFPDTCILGSTIETNRPIPVNISKAPSTTERLRAMQDLVHGRKFVSVEPVMDFDLDDFASSLLNIKPWAVAVGYDNYHNGLPEPSLEKVMRLIRILEENGVTVYRKTLREAQT